MLVREEEKSGFSGRWPPYSIPSLPTQQGILAWAVSLVGFPDGKREEEEEQALWGGLSQ